MTATLEQLDKPVANDSQTYRIMVVELDDVLPRRRSDRPNLLVRATVVDPELRVDQIHRGARPAWAEGHVVRLRPDLMAEPPTESASEAKSRARSLVDLLETDGYTVNRRSTPVWSTYVVQLDEARCDDPGAAWVYVGETSKSPEDRLVQHLAGRAADPSNPSSRTVYRYGQHLRYDLMAGRPKLYSAAESRAAEAALAEELRAEGYRVKGGH